MSETREVPYTLGPWETHYGHDLTGYPCFFIHGMSGDEKRDGDVLSANARLIASAPELLHALNRLVSVIDAAGLLNLSNGVQLGSVSWYCKADDALNYAKNISAKAARLAEREGAR